MTTQLIEPKKYIDVHGDHAVTRVTRADRKSMFDVAMVTAGCCICMSGLFTGAAMGAGLGLKDAVMAALLGNLILVFYGGLMGAAGAREGVGTAVLSRHAFGRGGSKVIGVILAITMLGWYSVQVGFFGETVYTMYPNGGFLTQPKVAAFWGGILMMVTAYAGYKGLSLLSKIAVPAILTIAVLGIFAAIKKFGGVDQILLITPKEPFGMGAGIVIAVGSFACGASAQADVTRYSKSVKEALLSCFLGFAFANTFVIIAGVLTSYATGDGNLPSSMLALGLGFPALIFLIAGQWTTNDNNLYIASLGLSNCCRFSKKTLVLSGGILATLLGVAGLYEHFTNWLITLGITIPPMAGIIIADYFLLKKGRYEFGPGTQYTLIHWPAFTSWSIASLIGFKLSWGNPSLNSLISSAVIYYLMSLTLNGMNIGGGTGTYEEDSTGY